MVEVINDNPNGVLKMKTDHETILRTASAVLGATLMICTGCASRPEGRYLQSGLTGFIYGPLPEGRGR